MQNNKLDKSAQFNSKTVLELCEKSSDVISKDVKIGAVDCFMMWCEGMVNLILFNDTIIRKIMETRNKTFKDGDATIDYLLNHNPELMGSFTVETIEDVIFMMMTGCVVVIAEGCTTAFVFPCQGYSFRGVSESYSEQNIRGTRESLVEPLRVNISLIRRRIKSENLVFKIFKVGKVSRTEIAIAYLKNRVSTEVIQSIEQKLSNVNIELVLESGFLQPFLEQKRYSIFSSIGYSERPDTICGKLREGRVAVIVDGTPYVLILPYLFSDNFTSFDDYTSKPYYTTMIRLIKYISFIISFTLPGVYLACLYYYPEMIPQKLIYNIYSSQNFIGIPLVAEALFIHFIYEIIKEAGLRLPKPIGHTISLIGALVVGEAATTVGIVSHPMLLVVALSTIAAFLAPQLQKASSYLRVIYIIVGFVFGAFGLVVLSAFVLLNICCLESYGTPILTPLSPLKKALFKDGILFKGWRIFAKTQSNYIETNKGEPK